MTHTTLTTEKVTLGFWLYIMSDCVLFAGLFAAYAVLHTQTFGGLSAGELFSLRYVFVETLLLLVSSFTVGLAVLAAHRGKKNWTLAALATTFTLGLSFIVMEVLEFSHLALSGAGPSKSAFLSSYFTLVGTHGLHVTLGALWMLVLLLAVAWQGLSASHTRRLLCLSLFWHFLDIIWIFIFTFVYLFGAL